MQHLSELKITFLKPTNYCNTLICMRIRNGESLAGLNNEEAAAAQVENNLHHVLLSVHGVFAIYHPS